MASCLPLGRIEVSVDDLVPRRGARVVWCDDGEGLAAQAAERRDGDRLYGCFGSGGRYQGMGGGWSPHLLWCACAGAFAEVVEHEAGTPYITAEELMSLIDDKADIAIYDEILRRISFQ